MYPTISSSIRHAARNWPGTRAVRSGGGELCYADLDEAADSLVRAWERRGLGRGDRVALLLHNCPEYLIAAIAAARHGSVLVPVNPRLSPGEVAYVLGDSGAALVMTSPALAPTLERALETVPGLGPGGAWILGKDEGRPAARGGPEVVDGPLRWEDDFLVIYTSGTTGTPKGAVISHGSRMLWILSMVGEYEIRRQDVYLAVMPMNHSAGITFALAHLHAGATVVVHDRFDAGRILDAIEEHGVTTVLLVPTMLVRLLEASPRDGSPRSLRRIISAGAALAEDVKRALLVRWPVDLFEYYGATESPNMTTLRPEDQLRKPRSVGQPFHYVEIRIVDDRGATLPAGEVGEIVARGPLLMTRYHGRPEETQVALRDGWYATGDLGYLDEERFLHLAGRKKDMLVSGGINIYPAEIEAALTGHPAVREVAVIGVRDPEWGETPLAIVVLHEGRTASEAEIIGYCKETLASYKKPRRVVFALDLPRTASGKVLKRELARRYGTPHLEEDR